MGLPAGGVMGIKLAHETDGVIAAEVVQPDGYLWSITDNGLAKATPMSEYPTQGRHGAGVINLRLPKEATEVVAAIVCAEKTELLVTTGIGSTKKLRVDAGTVGSRAVKPRLVITVGERNQITGAVQMTERPDVGAEEEETAVTPQQLTLLPDKPEKPTRKKK
ncbi:MAG: hypothetical protein HC804_02280 [Anaerolineae bacterium]|nr:hypothetical protein [Anaerolineae bacterium]